MNSQIVRHAYVRSACKIDPNINSTNQSNSNVNSVIVHNNKNSHSIFNMDSIIINDSKSVLQRKKQLQGLDIGFFENLLQAEDQLLKKRYTQELINKVVGLYAKCVEYYDSVQDPIKHYFLEKIQITLSSKESLKLIYTKNKNCDSNSNNKDSNNSDKENGLHRKKRSKGVQNNSGSSYNKISNRNNSNGSDYSQKSQEKKNLLFEKKAQFGAEDIKPRNIIYDINQQNSQNNISQPREDQKISLGKEQSTIQNNGLEQQRHEERKKEQFRYEQQLLAQKNENSNQDYGTIREVPITSLSKTSQKNDTAASQQSQFVETESNHRMSTVEETEKESARYSTLRSFCEWTDQENFSFSNGQKHIIPSPTKNHNSIINNNNSSNHKPRNNHSKSNSFNMQIFQTLKENNSQDYSHLHEYDDQHSVYHYGDNDPSSSQLHCQVFTSFIEGPTPISSLNHNNELQSIQDLLYERHSSSRAEMNVKDILENEDIPRKGTANRLIEHGKNIFNLNLARGIRNIKNKDNSADSEHSYLNCQIQETNKSLIKSSISNNAPQSTSQHLKNSKSLNNLLVKQPEVYSIPQKRIERSKRFSLFINMFNQKQHTDIKSDFSNILNRFEKDSMKKDAIVKSDIDQQMNSMQGRINQRKSKHLLNQVVRDMEATRNSRVKVSSEFDFDFPEPPKTSRF